MRPWHLNWAIQLSLKIRERAGSEDKETFHESDGLKAYIKDLNTYKETVYDIVYFKKKEGRY